MPRPIGLEFGFSPRQWIFGGLVCCAAGCVLVFVGGVVLFAPGVEPDAPRSVADVVFILLGSFGIGAAAVLTGVRSILKRRDFTIILGDHAVHVGPGYHRSTVAYRDITGVTRGTGGEVLVWRAGRFFGVTIPNWFASEEEASRFIEELKKRVENAKRLTESPPATS